MSSLGVQNTPLPIVSLSFERNKEKKGGAYVGNATQCNVLLTKCDMIVQDPGLFKSKLFFPRRLLENGVKAQGNTQYVTLFKNPR